MNDIFLILKRLYRRNNPYNIMIKTITQLFLMLCLFPLSQLNGQNINMPSAGTETTYLCSGTIYDSGGPDGNYINGDNGILIINPPGDGEITLEILSFSTENLGTSCYDYLTIYDGVGIEAPVFSSGGDIDGWCWDLDDSPPEGTGDPTGMTFTSTEGALTLQFISDASVDRAGFEATFEVENTVETPLVTFWANETETCTGVVAFQAEACNEPTSWSWDFGDGNTSDEQNPTHTYTTEGTYTVSLEVCNDAACTSETITDYISFGSADPSCFEFTMPSSGSETITACSGTFFDSGGPDGDYSSNESGVIVIEPEGADLVVLTFNSFNIETFFESMTIYDGNSTASPILLGGLEGSELPNGGAPILSTGNALTIEFTSDGVVEFSGWEATFECLIADEPPQAAFITTPPFSCDGGMLFLEQTLLPSDYSWDFGDGETSTEANPIHIYTSFGEYEVTLTTCNEFGCTSASQIVEVLDPGNPACGGVNMPSSSSLEIVECQGILYDSGGPDGNYGDNELSSVVIGNQAADEVSITFTQFTLDGGVGFGDFINIYDGQDVSAPLLGTYSGGSLPNNGNPIVGSSNYITIQFVSDGFSNVNGFQAYWNIQSSAETPVASFSLDGNNVPLNQAILFTDQSTNTPTAWTWDFGDGGFAFEQNPSHVFNEPGEYTVSLIASNCSGESEVYSETITVQDAALLIVNPSEFVIEVESGDIVDTTLSLSNFGVGDLIYDITGLENTYSGIVQVLVYNYETEDNDDATTAANTLGILQESIFGLNVFETNTTDPAALEQELENIDVLLVLGKKGPIDAGVMNGLSPVIQNFADNGGGVIFTASQFQSDAIFNSGMFEGSFGTGFYNPELEILDESHPLAVNVETPFEGKAGCAGYNIANEDKISLIVEEGLDVLTLREFDNNGKAILLGFNYLNYNASMRQILINSVLYGANIADAQWLFADPVSGSIGNFTTQDVTITVDASNTPGGVYIVNLIINTNDPNQPTVTVEVTLIVTGAPQISVTTEEIDFGNVVQFTEESQTFSIVNTGSDTLFIYDIIPENALFTVDTTNFFIYPGLSQTITITFSPTEIETLEDVLLTILSNDGEVIVLMDANATGAPAAVATPTPIEITLNVDESGSVPFNINNFGEGFLEFCLESTIVGENTGFDFTFTLDNFTEEFYWQLYDSNNEIVAEVLPNTYAEQEDQTTLTEILGGLNPDESYILLLLDTFGDGGLQFGEGYTITDLATGEVVATGEFDIGNMALVELGSPTQNPIDQWMLFDTECDTLPFPDGLSEIEVLFSAEGFLGGTYTTSILVNTNDPLNPVIEVPVIMTVVGIPNIEIVDAPADNILDFGSLIIGLDNSIQVTLSNTGTDSLYITDFLFESDQYDVDFEFITLAPGEETTITITFTPTEIGDASGTLTIVNNDENIVFDLIGFGQGAPAASTDPSSIEIELQAGETETIGLDLSNNGEGILDYEVFIEGGQTGFIFEFVTDGFPGELVWSIVDSDGNEVAGAPGGTYTEANQMYTEIISGLNAGETYSLTVIDTYFGCDGALSSYALYDLVTGDLIEEGGVLAAETCLYETTLGMPADGSIITVTPTSGTLDFPDLSNIEITVDAEGLEAGVYMFNLVIVTNDPLNPEIIIPVTVNVSAFPQAAFSADNEALVCGTEPINFFDESVNVPTSWLWNFGDGGTSDEQNPTYSYSESGTFDVTMIAINQVGMDTIVYEDFIVVDIECAAVSIPSTNDSPQLVENCNGKVYDSGGDAAGAVGNYIIGNQGILTIAPPGAAAVLLTFTTFDFTDINDTLYVYDGPDTDSDLLGAFTGTNLPNGDGAVQSTGGAITLKEASDDFINSAGFTASFICIKPEEEPIAAFSTEAINLCDGNIQFNDESELFPTDWHWDFGDGDSSVAQNPVHQYAESGSYTVILTASNEHGNSTSEMEVEVFVLSPVVGIPDTILAGETAVFTSEGDYNFSWDFGDGFTSSSPQPSHNYSFETDTVVTVTVTVTDIDIALDCQATVSEELYFFLEEPIDTMPMDTMPDTINALQDALIYELLNLYPNPTENQLNIQLELPEVSDIYVILTDPFGKTMYQDKVQGKRYDSQINLSHHPKGVYFVRFVVEDKMLVRRIVIQ